MAIDPARALALIEPFEGRCPHMYLDTVGKVTVGIGNMLPDAGAAACCIFVRPDGTEATDAEIAIEFGRVASAVPGLRADAYASIAALRMPDHEIERLFRRRVAEFCTQLEVHFPLLSEYPEPAQLALLDLAFNLGAAALPRKFPRLTLAVRAMDWRTAALESHRPQARDRRNAAIKSLFEDAAMAGAVPAREIT